MSKTRRSPVSIQLRQLVSSTTRVKVESKVFRLIYIAAAAARINASIQAKKGVQHVDVPPIRAVSYAKLFF